MAERSSLTQGVQIGVETTPGTGVAASKLLNSISIEPSVAVDMQRFLPMGQKYASIITPGKEWVEADISGRGTYSEIVYLLSSVCVAATPSTVDTSGKSWVFTPAARAEDTVKTYTVEQGGVVRAQKFSYGLVTSMELDFTRDGVEVTGSMIGQALQDGITLTAAPTAIEEKPILPTGIDVWLDTTSGGLGTTKQLRVLNAHFQLGDRFNPVWVLNSAQTSFVAHVEKEPTAQITILVEADSQGMAALTQLRAGTTKFIRIKATSPDLAGSATAFYSLGIDAAVKVSDVGNFSDEDGVYAIEFTFDIVYDATWTKAFEITAVNKVASL